MLNTLPATNNLVSLNNSGVKKRYRKLHFIVIKIKDKSTSGVVIVRFSAPVQTGPEAHPASCKMGTGSFPGVRCCRGVTLTPHPLQVQRSKIE